MYVPRSNEMGEDAEVRAFVREVGAAELVTTGTDGFPLATFLPVVWSGERVIAHFARANPHWEQIGAETPTLLVVRGAHAYVSPSWYAAKREHGRVVPTWNYSVVHLRGRARVFHDPAELLDAVTQLTDVHEGAREQPWAVSDAPAEFIEGMLRGIVGVEIAVERVEAKAKLSQNRSTEDRAGVVAGLREGGNERGEHEVAGAMATLGGTD